MKEIGYNVLVKAIVCDPEEGYKQYLKKVQDKDYSSAFHSQEGTISSFYNYFGFRNLIRNEKVPEINGETSKEIESGGTQGVDGKIRSSSIRGRGLNTLSVEETQNKPVPISPQFKRDAYLHLARLGQIPKEKQLPPEKVDEYFGVEKKILTPAEKKKLQQLTIAALKRSAKTGTKNVTKHRQINGETGREINTGGVESTLTPGEKGMIEDGDPTHYPLKKTP